MKCKNAASLLLVLMCLTTGVYAQEAATTVVEQTDIPTVPEQEQDEAQRLIEAARQRAQADADARAAAEQYTIPANAQRITYVPEVIKEEIREQVRSNLRADVLQDILAQARNEQWGIPQALPGWTRRLSLKGDLRLRHQSDLFADGNAAYSNGGATLGYYDFLAINSNGGYGNTDVEDAFLNTTEDRHRLRMRARVAMDARVDADVQAKLRLSTGGARDPVSTNQTLGQYGNPYAMLLDRAYLKYDPTSLDNYPWLTVHAGRMDSPWLSTDLVWDSDLAFEGVAATFRMNLRDTDNLFERSLRDRTLFVTAGVFPLQEIGLSADDKWLFGAQVGTELIAANQSRFNAGLAYYHYKNISGVRNPILDGTSTDYTAPLYMQKGNTVFDIRYDNDPDTDLWALAPQYKLLNLTLSYDYTGWSPMRVVTTLDVVKNIGYDRADIERRIQGGAVERAGGTKVGEDPLRERTLGYHLAVSVGWPLVSERRTWRVFGGYKHLQRDAVVDAFTDSDFHLGGTDAQGWYLGGEYAVLDNIVAAVRYLTADAIDGAPFGVDTIQLDLNARF